MVDTSRTVSSLDLLHLDTSGSPMAPFGCSSAYILFSLKASSNDSELHSKDYELDESYAITHQNMRNVEETAIQCWKPVTYS